MRYCGVFDSCSELCSGLDGSGDGWTGSDLDSSTNADRQQSQKQGSATSDTFYTFRLGARERTYLMTFVLEIWIWRSIGKVVWRR